MARRTDTTPEQVSDARIRWLRSQTRKLWRDHADARAAGSWSAVAALAREIRTLRDQLDDALLKRAAERAEADAAPEELSPAERRAKMAEVAEVATDDELEVFVRAWLQRHRYELRVDSGGLMHLRRQGTVHRLPGA